MRLWDAANWQPRGTLHGHGGAVHWVGFTDNQTVLTVGHDRTLRVWDAATLKERSRGQPFEQEGTVAGVPRDVALQLCIGGVVERRAGRVRSARNHIIERCIRHSERRRCCC